MDVDELSAFIDGDGEKSGLFGTTVFKGTPGLIVKPVNAGLICSILGTHGPTGIRTVLTISAAIVAGTASRTPSILQAIVLEPQHTIANLAVYLEIWRDHVIAVAAWNAKKGFLECHENSLLTYRSFSPKRNNKAQKSSVSESGFGEKSPLLLLYTLCAGEDGHD